MAINNQTNLGIGDSEQIQEWLSGVTYQPSEEVSNDFNVYICLVCHVSGDFATDLASAYWFLVGGVGAIETDPVFTASPASGITSGDITNWDTAFGWGNHATAGYLLAASATWAAILATGAESGANNPIINDGQYIGFRSGAFTNTLDTKTLAAGRTQSFQDRDGILAHTDQIPTVSDVAYAASWDGNLDAATKNAIYDKIETLGAGFETVKQNGGGDVNAVPRSILNFIEGTGMNLTAVDNAGLDRVDITYDFQGDLQLVLGNGNSMSNEGIIAFPQNGSFEYIGTNATETATSAMIQYLTPADAGSGIGLNYGLKLISGLGGTKATKVAKLELNGEYAFLDWGSASSYLFIDDSGVQLYSEDQLNLIAGGVTNLNKIFVSDGAFGGNKFALDFGAMAANYTATWQQASGTVAYLTDIPAASLNGIFDAANSGSAVASNFEASLTTDFRFTIAGNQSKSITVRDTVQGVDRAELGNQASEGGVLYLRAWNETGVRTKLSGDKSGTSYFNSGNSDGKFGVNVGSTLSVSPIEFTVGHVGGTSTHNYMFQIASTNLTTIRNFSTHDSGSMYEVVVNTNAGSTPANQRIWGYHSYGGAGGGYHTFEGWNDDNAIAKALKRTTVRQEYFRADDTAFIINNSLNNYDFIVKGDADALLMVADAGLDKIGIGRTPVASKLEINGDVETVNSTDGFIVLDRTNGNRYRIYTDGGVLNREIVV